MADLIRTQGYQAQVSGVPGAATPSVSFGQRRPDIEFQAKANYQQTLAKALDRISETAFGFAEQMAPRAGAQFALENQLTQEQLNAMASGDMSTVDLGSPMNVFSAAVRKARAIELSGHMEAEARQEMVSLYEKASRGELSTEEATGKIRGLLNAGGSTLAQVDPDAAFKYRASIATIGGKVIDEIGKAELKRRAIINEQKLSTDYGHILTGINAYMTSTMPINPDTGEEWDHMEVIAKIKENFLNNAFAIGGLPVMESYADQIDKDIERLKLNVVASYVSDSDNPIAAFDQLRKGKTSNKFVNSLVGPGAMNRVAMLDAARKELSAFNTLEEQRIAENERQSSVLEADFADAMASGNRTAMNSVLKNLRNLSPSKYATLKKVASEGGGVFSSTDNGNVVADLERRLNDPYGAKVTVNEVFQKRGQLTQGTFSKYINAAKVMEDEQIEIMLDQAASQLGMMRGAVLMPGVERARQERAIADLKVKFVAERRRNPNVDVFEFLENNFDKTKRTAKVATDNEVFNKIQSFTYKSEKAFNDAIRNAERTKNSAQANTLKEQRTEFLDAVKNGVIDANGNRIRSE